MRPREATSLFQRTQYPKPIPFKDLFGAHGYLDPDLHTLPVESVFVSIAALHACVSFRFSNNESARPLIRAEGLEVSAQWYERMTRFVDRILAFFEINGSYEIGIEQNFLSGIGVGSSAAVYAALTQSISHVIPRKLSSRHLSALARLGSYSAASAIIGNVSVVKMSPEPADNVAEIICEARNFPYHLLILPVAGLKHSEEIHTDILSSPFYQVWLQSAKKLSTEIVSLISAGHFRAVGPKVEAYIYENHAAISTGSKNLMTWTAGTVERLVSLNELRKTSNIPFFLSMNSGPAVFIYVRSKNEVELVSRLDELGLDYIVSDVGGPSHFLDSEDS